MKLVTIIVCIIMSTALAAAESIDARPSVYIASIAHVKGAEVLLRDVAQIHVDHKEIEPLAKALGQVKLIDAPAPRMVTTITGARILEAIEQTGIPRSAFGYSIPQVVTVEREGRVITPDEVLSATREKFVKDPTLDVQVREVNLLNQFAVPLGETELEVDRLGAPVGGKVPLRVEVFVDKNLAARFLATALVDDWKAIPVVTRNLQRGSLISQNDVELIRMNLAEQPLDVVSDISDVVGKLVKSQVQAGATVRKTELVIPPTVEKGKRVIMIFRNGGLEASASGVAIEDGTDGALIHVRNENSKKIIEARVMNSEEVEVAGQ